MLDSAAHLLSTVGDGALVAYLGILGVKFALSRRYAATHREEFLDEAPVTILQPILSGDPSLEETLRRNLQQAPPWARFLWLIDEDDAEAHRLTGRLRDESDGRVDIVVCPPAIGDVNPKTLKLQHGLASVATPYLAVLDDDTLLVEDNIGRALFALRSCALYTGLPCYLPGCNFWSAMVAYFVNNNSILTYLPLLPLVGPLTINGMFYVMRTQTVEDMGGFTPILDQLCDDYALARHVRAHGGVIRQAATPHFLRTTVPGPGPYFRLMHRWFVFARVLVSDQPVRVAPAAPRLPGIASVVTLAGPDEPLRRPAVLAVAGGHAGPAPPGPAPPPSDGLRRTLTLQPPDVDPRRTAPAAAWASCVSPIRTAMAHAAHPAGARRDVHLPPGGGSMIVFQEPRSHPVTPIKVVLLSGLSDPATCRTQPDAAAVPGGPGRVRTVQDLLELSVHPLSRSTAMRAAAVAGQPPQREAVPVRLPGRLSRRGPPPLASPDGVRRRGGRHHTQLRTGNPEQLPGHRPGPADPRRGPRARGLATPARAVYPGAGCPRPRLPVVLQGH